MRELGEMMGSEWAKSLQSETLASVPKVTIVGAECFRDNGDRTWIQHKKHTGSGLILAGRLPTSY